MHTASRMNPVDALAQVGRESRHAYEAEMVLNLQQLEAAAARNVSLENLGLLAERIAAWGAEMCRGGQMMERERYQEQGE